MASDCAHRPECGKDSGLARFASEFSALGRNVNYFITARLMEGSPSVWPDRLEYVTWRHAVAESLAVDPLAVQLVGSARLGYSLNPAKGYKLFDEQSDLDIAIVSSEYFERAWVELRKLLEGPVLDGRKGYIRKLVFEECIALDVVLPHLSFGKEWSRARDGFLDPLGRDFASREVNYRVYRNNEALRSYQLKSVETAENRAIEDGVLNVR